LRRRRRRRRHRLATYALHHPPLAQTRAADGRRDERHRRLPSLRPTLHDHQRHRRAGALDPRARYVHLRDRVHGLPPRLRRGHGVAALRDDRHPLDPPIPPGEGTMKRAAIEFSVLLAAILFLAPVALIYIESLKPDAEIVKFESVLPKEPARGVREN